MNLSYGSRQVSQIMDYVFFIVFLSLMMEALPSSSRYTTASIRHRHKNRTQALCVGGKWFQVGSFRFWQRSTCAKRRQAKMLAPGIKPVTVQGQVGPRFDKKVITNKPSTIDFELLIPSAEDGPKRHPFYDPNYGHEPYWAHGDWVFDKSPYDKPGNKYMCGVRCPEMYQEFGKVCGKDKDDNYETFENFCQLKNKDCTFRSHWMPLYKGECYRYLHKFPFIDENNQRSENLINSLLAEVPNLEKYVGHCENCENPSYPFWG